MLQQINSLWGIESKHVTGDVFTGYEEKYSLLDTFTSDVFEKDPEGTVDKVFDIYRSVNLVPII